MTKTAIATTGLDETWSSPQKALYIDLSQIEPPSASFPSTTAEGSASANLPSASAADASVTPASPVADLLG